MCVPACGEALLKLRRERKQGKNAVTVKCKGLGRKRDHVGLLRERKKNIEKRRADGKGMEAGELSLTETLWKGPEGSKAEHGGVITVWLIFHMRSSENAGTRDWK